MSHTYVRPQRSSQFIRSAIRSLTLTSVGVVSVSAQQVASAPAVAAQVPALVFDGVTVVDVAEGRLLPKQRVVVLGNRIQAVGPVRNVGLPPGAHVVDASGRYLIPGLWDMHVHAGKNAPAKFYPRFIANGVTGLRELAQRFRGGPDSFRVWQRNIAAGISIGPRIVGPSIDLTPPTHYGSKSAMGKDAKYRTEGYFPIYKSQDAPGAMDTIKDGGSVFIKYHDDNGDRDLFFAILREARRVGLPVVGHVPKAVTSVEASDSGMRSIEHIVENRQCWPNWPRRLGDSSTIERLCAPAVKAFLRNGTWIVPTLAAFYSSYLEGGFGGLVPVEIDDHERLVRTMYRQGLRNFLAGTDTYSDVRPGFALRQELLLLVEAGLTPLDALRAATLHPAQFFGATDSLGTIARGKLADLVLLDNNPLADIRNVLKLRAVVANGRYFDRAALDSLDPGAGMAADTLLAIGRFLRRGVHGIDSMVDVPTSAGRAATQPPGAIVYAIAPNSAAEAAGINVGDLIVAVDSEPVKSAKQVWLKLRRLEGRVLKLDVVREGSKPRTVSLTLRTPRS